MAGKRTPASKPAPEPTHYAVDLVRAFPLPDGRHTVAAGPGIVAAEIAALIPDDMLREPKRAAEV